MVEHVRTFFCTLYLNCFYADYTYAAYIRIMLLCRVVGLVYILYNYIWATPVSGLRRRSRVGEHKLSDADVQARLAGMHDTRPASCVSKSYDMSRWPAVSVLFTYHNEEFYTLKLSLTSFRRFTPTDAYSEVIIVDDGTDDNDVKTDASKFFATYKFKSLRLVRSDSHDGEAASRYKAAKSAAGAILVFANHQVRFNAGWLQPLVRYLVDHPNTVVMPHADSHIHNSRFFPLSSSLVHVMTLSLGTIHLETNDDTDDDVIRSPVMRGDVFAVIREYYESLGEFDDAFIDGGGHDLELSLRTWLCGGEIKIVQCSRVAVSDAITPREVTQPRNAQRLTEL